MAVAALLLGSMTLLPLAIFPWMKRPSAPLPWSVAGFKTLAVDLGALVRQPVLLLALLFFLAPVGAFSLTNYLPTHAADFHASEAFASRVGGAAILIGSLLGPAIFGIIGRLLSIPAFYLAIGTVGSAVTIASCAVDPAPAAFAGILVVQNVFQNIGVAAQTAFELDTIGRNNPLSATAMSLMNAAIAAPLSYMLIVESWGYGWRGWQGSLIFDGSVAVSSGLLCFIVLGVVARRKTL